MTQAKDHWERAWDRGTADAKSWFQREPALSLELITNSGVDKSAGVIDVGGGASSLVLHLLQHGYQDLTVLDISSAALEISRQQLGVRAEAVAWIEQDITTFRPQRRWALWHDRAVFHFMRETEQRLAYKKALREGLEPGGTLVLSTFAEDGPPRCSGLEVVRYSTQSICDEMGPDFRLRETRREAHHTPMGTVQQFGYYRFQRAE